MRKILASLILVFILSGISSADLVYTTSSGNMGMIKVSGPSSIDAPAVKYTIDGTNPMTVSYWNASSARVMLIDRTTDRTTSGDTALIFDPSDLTKPLNSEPVILNGIYNTTSVGNSYNGRSVFFTSEGSAKIIDLSTSDFGAVRSYTYKNESSDDEYVPEIPRVIAGTYTVYGVVNVTPTKSKVLRFDGQLRDDINNFASIEASPDVSDLVWLSNSRVAIGHSSGVDILNRESFVSIVSTDSPVKAICEDDDTGFYFITQDNSASRLLHYYKGETTEMTSGASGTICRAVRDDSYEVLGVIMGGKVLVYNIKEGTLLGEYDSSTLGGTPLSIAKTSASGGEEYNSGSSGCDVSGSGVIMIMSLGLLIFRRK